MFVFSKGRPRTFNPIRIPTKFPEKEGARKNSFFSVTDEKMRSARSGKQRKPVGTEKIKGNIWYYPVGKGHSTNDVEAFKHPAIFPERLVYDHILSWSNPNDIVFDPFLGSGTTGKIALVCLRRFVGFELSKEYFVLARNRMASAYRDRDHLVRLHSVGLKPPKGKANVESLKTLTLSNLLWILKNKPDKLARLLTRNKTALMSKSRDVATARQLLPVYLKYNKVNAMTRNLLHRFVN
jgi:hypothetical protein